MGIQDSVFYLTDQNTVSRVFFLLLVTSCMLI